MQTYTYLEWQIIYPSELYSTFCWRPPNTSNNYSCEAFHQVFDLSIKVSSSFSFSFHISFCFINVTDEGSVLDPRNSIDIKDHFIHFIFILFHFISFSKLVLSSDEKHDIVLVLSDLCPIPLLHNCTWKEKIKLLNSQVHIEKGDSFQKKIFPYYHFRKYFPW